MEITHIAHVAICVASLEKSLEFYQDLLGLYPKMQQTQDMALRPGSQSHFMYKDLHAQRKVANIYINETDTVPFLVLTSHPNDNIDQSPIKLDQVGITHLSLKVTNVEETATHLLSNGIKLAGAEEDFKDNNGNIRTFFVLDPDGILVQFE
jgi:glyoxylase I family protein